MQVHQPIQDLHRPAFDRCLADMLMLFAIPVTKRAKTVHSIKEHTGSINKLKTWRICSEELAGWQACRWLQ